LGKKRKPHDPSAQARAEAERKARKAEVERLTAAGANVKTDAAGRIISAWRTNVFQVFLTRKTIDQDQFSAAHRLAQTWAIWKGLEGKREQLMEVVCGSGELEPPETGFIAAQRQEEAGARVATILFSLSRQDAALIAAFMVATVEEDRPMEWRGIVERETGIAVRDRQTEAVVQALTALRSVYEQPRRAAA